MPDSSFVMTRLQRVLAAAGLIAVAALTGGAGGYYLGHRAAKAEGDAALATLKSRHATAQAEATSQARAREQELNQLAHTLGMQLLEERAGHAQQADQLKRTINRVTSQYRPQPDAPLQPVPDCVFTGGFVRVWNGAIGAGPLSAAGPASGAADAADPAEATDSGVRQSDVLAHVVDYGQRCRDVESQLNHMIDWLQGERDGYR